MSKPTPGPWRVVNTKEEQYDGDYIADLSNDLLIVPPSIHFLGDPLADSALMAAAPELLDLLIKAQRLGLTFDIGTAYIRRSYIDKQDELNALINALIKKIGGAV